MQFEQCEPCYWYAICSQEALKGDALQELERVELSVVADQVNLESIDERDATGITFFDGLVKDVETQEGFDPSTPEFQEFLQTIGGQLAIVQDANAEVREMVEQSRAHSIKNIEYLKKRRETQLAFYAAVLATGCEGVHQDESGTLFCQATAPTEVWAELLKQHQAMQVFDANDAAGMDLIENHARLINGEYDKPTEDA